MGLLRPAAGVGGHPARAEDAPTRIAVVADPDCANLAALVTTELSGDGALHLLERDELSKVGDEARLQQLARQDTVNLGKLVGADGLLFLHKADANARVRLTATALGFALYDGQVPPGDARRRLPGRLPGSPPGTHPSCGSTRRGRSRSPCSTCGPSFPARNPPTWNAA